jgi:hypothetical protein
MLLLARLSALPGRQWSSHSLRHGGVTAAYRSGVPFPQLMQLGNWKDPKVVLNYIEKDSVIERAKWTAI